MSDDEQKSVIEKEIEALVTRLDRGEISEEEFQRQMAQLVASAATEAVHESTEHRLAHERIQAASKRAKQL